MTDDWGEFGAWIDEHCVCATCAHGVERNLFGDVFCDQADSIAGGWNPGTARCEEHYFRDPALRAEEARRMDAYYEEEIRPTLPEELR